ncbi:MAG TPA: S41 family peptidase [Vicinamibacteria bacterium]|nr:S41 family peptidase [Vicinamibacteria bacterium]
MSPRIRLLVALISTTLIGYIAVGSLLGRVLGDSTYSQLNIFNEVVRLVLDAYVDRVDLDRAMSGARLGMTDALDGDSAYLDPEELRQVQEQPGRDSDADVGLLLSRRFSFLIVASTRAGSPAEKAGVKPGDVIKTIDGRHTRSIAAPVGQRLLRGAPGSMVKLSLLRQAEDPLDVSLPRERPQPQAARGRVVQPGIGYLKVPEVEARTIEEVRGELETLRRAGAHSLVLDLRGNGFGPLAEGPRLAELFLKGGVVAKLTGSRVPEEVFTADARRSAWAGPLAVIVDTGTVGAAEIAAAALGEAERGTLVGTRTFGRAPQQKLVSLPEGGLLITIARFTTAKGTAIHTRGVEPAVKVQLPDEDEDAGDKAPDRFLEKALETLQAEAKKAA